MIVNGTNKKVQLYGGIQTNSTYQTVKYLTGVPQGTYRVRILLSSGNSTSYKLPNIVRVNNSIQTITDNTPYFNNNSNWLTFENITVDSDGYMLLSQYTNTMFTAGTFRLPPIVLVEITKVS